MSNKSGFTIVELLVVISIIALLLALLTPALDKAVQSAQTAVCLSNQHNIGVALNGYHHDYKNYYCMLDTWWTLLGKKEAFNPLIPVPADVKDRPLNAYLGYTSNGTEVPVARCPSDLGDPLFLVQNPHDYTFAGTSYLGAFDPVGDHSTRVKIVFGFTGRNPRNEGWVSYYPLPSVKWTNLVRMDNKVVLMDANWHTDRETSNPQVRWHRPDSPERLLATLFADSHAELFDWVKEDIDPKCGGTPDSPPDPSWKWW